MTQLPLVLTKKAKTKKANISNCNMNPAALQSFQSIQPALLSDRQHFSSHHLGY